MVAAISSRALSRGVLLSIRRPWVVGCLGLWVVGCAGGSRDPAGESEAAAATTIMDSTSLAPSTGSEGGATTGTDGPEQPTGGPSTGTTGAADSSSSEGVASSTGAEEGTDTGEPCGNGVVEGNEACDEGRETATCDLDCTLAACGDGEHNAMAGEECDDGDLLPLDRCSPVCLATPVRLAVGRTHMCALAGDDTVHCWGGGESGQLGYGSTTNLGDQPGELPTAKVPVGGAVAQLGLGFDHTCAVMSAGGVRCWGRGGSGQLGTGGTHNIGDTPGELPVPDIAVGASVVQVAGGNEHTCAIVEGGAVRCWGGNWYGQLGYGNTAELLAPDGADVPWIVGARQLVAGALHNCALLADDSVHCWGENSYGQLGLGSVTAIGDEPGEGAVGPTPVGDPGDPVVQLASGYVHTCAVLASGKVRCWGWNMDGQGGSRFGDPRIGDAPGEMPPPDVDLGGAAVQVVAGFAHTCALMADRAVKCWGAPIVHGYPGLGAIDSAQEFPPPDLDIGGEVAAIAGHMGSWTCAQRTDQSVRCWGENANGQLGVGSTDSKGDDETPASVMPVPL
jgi:cysteine-rich repeat protein